MSACCAAKNFVHEKFVLALSASASETK